MLTLTVSTDPIEGFPIPNLGIITKEDLQKDAHLILQVHDELVYEIKEEKAKKIADNIKEIMESVIDPKDIKGITCVANYAIGKNWGELK